MTRLLLILALFVAPLAAQESSYSVTTDFTYSTGYLFRGIKSAEGSFQPAIEIEWGSLYGNIYLNQPLDKEVDNEIDFTAGGEFELTEWLSLDVGATAYCYPETDDTYSIEGYLGLKAVWRDFGFAFHGYRDIDLMTTTFENSAIYTLPLTEEASIELCASLGRVSHSYTYWGAGATALINLSKSTTFKTGVQYSSHNLLDVENDHVWVTVGLSVSY